MSLGIGAVMDPRVGGPPDRGDAGGPDGLPGPLGGDSAPSGPSGGYSRPTRVISVASGGQAKRTGV